jgi:hypothetical protein
MLRHASRLTLSWKMPRITVKACWTPISFRGYTAGACSFIKIGGRILGRLICPQVTSNPGTGIFDHLRHGVKLREPSRDIQALPLPREEVC